jgi:uncharacterized protein (TIGR02145 family)
MRQFFQILTLPSLFIFCSTMSSCQQGTAKQRLPMGVDEVAVGNQIWMNKNLNVNTFQNGDPIFEAKTKEDWMKCDSLKQPAWCYYENNPSNDSLYGKMYNWYAVNDPRKLAPAGWHVASDNEWLTMLEFLGGYQIAGKKIKAKQGWNVNGIGTNESGLSIVAAGERHVDGEFSSAGLLTAFWTSTPFDSAYAWEYYLYHFNDRVGKSNVNKSGGLSVRCIKDEKKPQP